MRASAAGMRLAGTLCPQQSQPRATARGPGYSCRGLLPSCPASTTPPPSRGNNTSHWHRGNRRRHPAARADSGLPRPIGESSRLPQSLILSPRPDWSLSAPSLSASASLASPLLRQRASRDLILEPRNSTGFRKLQSNSKQAPSSTGTRTPGGAVHRARSMGDVPKAGQGVGPVASGERQQPILLLDVMDTIVADPFHWHIPHFFG